MKAEITFEACGTFKAFHNAETWMRENGFSWGSMCRDEPIGMIRGLGIHIAKWRNLSMKDRKACDAILIPCPDFREGGCAVVFQNGFTLKALESPALVKLVDDSQALVGGGAK